ncbi:alpha/beta fold hydrolase [Amaricoccus macauensis]|uniref:alpha/beta fold hydrolase n=1 Tax=Amaricoccus macauensis TaxID=57001 RepID=UPI003C7DA6CF
MGELTLHTVMTSDACPPEKGVVVLVHGLGMSSRYMIPLARHLASNFWVCAPDLPGFGLSSKPRHVLTVRELADALAALLSVMGIQRAAFIGNSLGCEILAELALRHPERVERLILQGPTPDPKDRSALQKVTYFAITCLFERWSLGWIALSDYFRCGICRYFITFHHMMEQLLEPKLPLIAAPTLIVWGARDYIVPLSAVERYARLLPNGHLAVVPGAAHGMNYSHPELLVRTVHSFLNECEGHGHQRLDPVIPLLTTGPSGEVAE